MSGERGDECLLDQSLLLKLKKPEYFLFTLQHPPSRIRHGIEALTSREKEVLRQVTKYSDAKAIGRKLGISHETVNLHLKRAREKLGSSTRFQAAETLALHEGRTQSMGTGPLGMLPTEHNNQTEASLEPARPEQKYPGVREQALPFAAFVSDRSVPRTVIGQMRPVQRVMTIMTFAVLIAVLVLAAVPLGREAQRLASIIGFSR